MPRQNSYDPEVGTDSPSPMCEGVGCKKWGLWRNDIQGYCCTECYATEVIKQTKRGSRIPVWFDLLVECKAIIVKARADLGHDLGGHSVIDLLCDNTEEGTDVLELVLKDLGEA